jgi:hypothetical protein
MSNAAETRLGAVNTIANKNRPNRRNIMTMKRPPAGCQERRRVGETPRVRRVANTSESHCRRRRRPTEKQRCKLERPIEGINDVTSDDPVSPLCVQ